MNKVSPDNIVSLQENEVFVFGSNAQGNHASGAAKYAQQNFKATPGIARGFTGQCYGIDTMSGMEIIKEQIGPFFIAASVFTEKIFLVTELGCGIAGYTPEEIAPLFKQAKNVNNIHLPQRFWEVIEQEEKQSQVNQHRMIFYALLEAAMRYREGFWREDIDNYEKNLSDQVKTIMESGKYGTRKRVSDNIKARVLNFTQASEKLNEQLYGVIEAVNKSFSPAAQKAFDNYSTAWALMCEELMKAKNTTEILSICQLYNTGNLDYIFAELRNSEFKQTLNDKYENKDQSIVHDGDHLRIPSNELQKEQPSSSNNEPAGNEHNE